MAFSPVESKSSEWRTHDSGASSGWTVRNELVRSTPHGRLSSSRLPSRGRPDRDPRIDVEEKVQLFRSLFRGRSDVYALRWEQASTGKKGWSPAVLGGWSKGTAAHPQLLPLTDDVMSKHLAGRATCGLYPLMSDDTCLLLASDFDGPGSLLTRSRTSTRRGARASRLRSNDHVRAMDRHVWMFFADAIAASAARRIGTHLIRKAMTARAEIDLVSYDRLFPAQDFLPRQGFGNLIALPLQGECRKKGTTVFLDPSSLEPYSDQWELLASVDRLSGQRRSLARASVRWPSARSRTSAARLHHGHAASTAGDSGASVGDAGRGSHRDCHRRCWPLKHAASLHNPEFYEKERDRLDGQDTPLHPLLPRDPRPLLVPRGIRPQAETIATEAGSRLEVADAYLETETIGCQLAAELRPDQEEAVEVLVAHERGCWWPARGRQNGDGLRAHRPPPGADTGDSRPRAPRRAMAGTPRHAPRSGQETGRPDRRNRKASGVVDLAMAQSLARRDDLGEVSSVRAGGSR